MAPKSWLENSGVARVVTLTLLVGLVAFHAVNNWLWLKANVTILGWDVPSHLGTSYIYNYMLRPLTLKTLFATIVWHPNRPPLPFLAAVPLYRLFGVSPDVGTMVSVLFLAVLFGAVYGIGRRLGGPRVGLLAAFVLATLPMIYALSRYFYLELPLTAMVALSIYLLLASERFENRTVSLLFGLSFGLGLLTKRTYLAFVLIPLCLVVGRSQVLASLKSRLWRGESAGAPLHAGWRDAMLALGLGLALSAAWYLPSREIASQLPLGWWLLPLWAVLIAATIFLVRLQPGPDSNLLAALFLGATIGSLWYLPRITFLERLLSMGFGVNDPRERSANLDALGTYLYFPARLVSEHLSLVTFVLLIVAVAGLVLCIVRRGSIRDTLRRADDAWWVTTLWIVAAYLIFTLSIYRKSRGFVPVLPAVALLLAAGLFSLPWKRAVSVLVVLVIAWGLLQFFVLSYPGLHWVAESTAFDLPILGESGVFARGGSIQLPASGQTDPRYWVVPDLLQDIEAERRGAGAASTQVGVLVNNEHVNPDLLGMLALQSYPAIQVQNLATTESRESIVPRLFEQDYLVLIDGDYMLLDGAAQEALHYLQTTPGFFDAAFELAQRFPLPDGDTVLLYRKAYRPAYGAEEYRDAAQTIARLAREGDAILLVPPEQVEPFARAYEGELLGGQGGVSLLPYVMPGEQPLDVAGTHQALAEITARHPVLFVLFRDEGAVDPQRRIEQWLNQNAYRAWGEWFGGVRLAIYGAPRVGADDIEQPLAENLQLGEGIHLLGFNVAEQVVEPGQVVRLSLFWQADEPVGEPFTVFAHLLDQNGRLVAQQDGEPVGGSRPTTSWSAGEVIRDHVGVLIPPDAAPGEYRLAVGMYRPDSGERLPVLSVPVTGGPTALGDQILLDESPIQVQAP